MRVASDQSLLVGELGIPRHLRAAGCSSRAARPAQHPGRCQPPRYHDDFAAHPERWQLQSVSGLGQHAKEALSLPSPGVANDPVLAPHLLGSAQLDVLSGHWLVTVQYLGAAAGSAEVAPELDRGTSRTDPATRARAPLGDLVPWPDRVPDGSFWDAT